LAATTCGAGYSSVVAKRLEMLSRAAFGGRFMRCHLLNVVVDPKIEHRQRAVYPLVIDAGLPGDVALLLANPMRSGLGPRSGHPQALSGYTRGRWSVFSRHHAAAA